MLVGGVRATQITALSETSLTAVVPAPRRRDRRRPVATANGTTPIASKDHFKYGKPTAPTVTFVGPASGSKAGGTEVTVGGTNFVAGMKLPVRQGAR